MNTSEAASAGSMAASMMEGATTETDPGTPAPTVRCSQVPKGLQCAHGFTRTTTNPPGFRSRPEEEDEFDPV